MLYLNAQKRLRGLFGADSIQCFHVFALVSSKKITDPDEVDEYLKARNVDTVAKPLGNLPEHRFGRARLNAGTYSAIEPRKFISPIAATPIFTLASYNIDAAGSKQTAEMHLNIIRQQYVDNMTEERTDLVFNEQGQAISTLDERLKVEFRYVVQAYDPQVCHPRDLGVLQPITTIPGVVIHPDKDTIPDLKALRQMQPRSTIAVTP
jgi:hypothetical protein